MSNRFLFVDETGTKKQDDFFIIGFLRVDNPDKYFKTLSLYRDKLFGMNRELRKQRIELLARNDQTDQLIQLAESAFKFELKYSKINNYNYKIYIDFITTLLDIGIHFVSIGIDRNDPFFKDNAKLIASYKRVINVYLEKYQQPDSCLIVDDFGIQISNFCNEELLPKYFLRSLSESNIYLQAVDILSGLVSYGLRASKETKSSKKDIFRNLVLARLEEKIHTKITKNFTVNYNTKSGYFSNWILDFGKSHGH